MEEKDNLTMKENVELESEAKFENNLITQKRKRGLLIGTIVIIVLSAFAFAFMLLFMKAQIETLKSEDSKEVLGGIILAIILLPMIIMIDIFIGISHTILIILHVVKMFRKTRFKAERIAFVILVALTLAFIIANTVFFIMLKHKVILSFDKMIF